MGSDSDSDDSSFRPAARSSSSAPPQAGGEKATDSSLGLVLLSNLWTGTRGTLSLDLKRPTIPKQLAARDGLLRYRRQQQATTRPPGLLQATHAYTASFALICRSQGQFASTGRRYAGQALPTVRFSDTGARVKVMRHVDLGPKFEALSGTGATKEYSAMDIGVGLNFELDTAELQPQARIKLWDVVSLRALPTPGLKLSKRLPVGTSDFGVRISYDCPLDNLQRFWEPPARLMVSLDNLSSNGVRLTNEGVEFNGGVTFADGNLTIRGAGQVQFPQRLPVEEGEPLVRYELRRLGLKANW